MKYTLSYIIETRLGGNNQATAASGIPQKDLGGKEVTKRCFIWHRDKPDAKSPGAFVSGFPSKRNRIWRQDVLKARKSELEHDKSSKYEYDLTNEEEAATAVLLVQILCEELGIDVPEEPNNEFREAMYGRKSDKRATDDGAEEGSGSDTDHFDPEGYETDNLGETPREVKKENGSKAKKARHVKAEGKA